MIMRSTTALLMVLCAGCREPGLPPEPPGLDAADPEAPGAPAQRRADPFTRSAFEGVKLGGGGHDHHGHHGHRAQAPAGDAEAPTGDAEAPVEDAKAPAEPHASHGGGS